MRHGNGHARKIPPELLRQIRRDYSVRQELLSQLRNTKSPKQWADEIGISESALVKAAEGLTYKVRI